MVRIKRFSWLPHLRSAMQGSPLGQFFLVASKELQGRQGKSESENMGDHWYPGRVVGGGVGDQEYD